MQEMMRSLHCYNGQLAYIPAWERVSENRSGGGLSEWSMLESNKETTEGTSNDGQSVECSCHTVKPLGQRSCMADFCV